MSSCKKYTLFTCIIVLLYVYGCNHKADRKAVNWADSLKRDSAVILIDTGNTGIFNTLIGANALNSDTTDTINCDGGIGNNSTDHLEMDTIHN